MDARIIEVSSSISLYPYSSSDCPISGVCGCVAVELCQSTLD